MALASYAANIGDTYDQVIAEKGKPLSHVAAGSRRVLQYDDMSIVLKNGRVVTIRLSSDSMESRPLAPTTPKPEPTTTEGKIAAAKQEMAVASNRVRAIVNQPPPSQPADPGIPVSYYKPGWFHDGTTKPDFNTVDVRQTQQFPYEGKPFVSSDLNLGTIFPGAALEFNPMLKYFYMDRTLPKKRLTASEMIEINQLYRIIGRCEQQLAELHAQ